MSTQLLLRGGGRQCETVAGLDHQDTMEYVAGQQVIITIIIIRNILVMGIFVMSVRIILIINGILIINVMIIINSMIIIKIARCHHHYHYR